MTPQSEAQQPNDLRSPVLFSLDQNEMKQSNFRFKYELKRTSIESLNRYHSVPSDDASKQIHHLEEELKNTKGRNIELENKMKGMKEEYDRKTKEIKERNKELQRKNNELELLTTNKSNYYWYC